MWKLVIEDDEGKLEVTRLTKWMDPARARREIAMEEIRERPRDGQGRREGGRGRHARKAERMRIVQAYRWELVSYRESREP